MELKKVIVRIDEGGKTGPEQTLVLDEKGFFKVPDKQSPYQEFQVQKLTDPVQQDMVRIRDTDKNEYVADCKNESGKAVQKLCIYDTGNNGRIINVRFFYDTAEAALQPEPVRPTPPPPLAAAPAAPRPPRPAPPPATPRPGIDLGLPKRSAARPALDVELGLPPKRSAARPALDVELGLPPKRSATTLVLDVELGLPKRSATKPALDVELGLPKRETPAVPAAKVMPVETALPKKPAEAPVPRAVESQPPPPPGPNPKQVKAQKVVIQQMKWDYQRLQQNDAENLWLQDKFLKSGAEKAAKALKNEIEKLLGKDPEKWDLEKIVLDDLQYHDKNHWVERYTAAKDVLALIANPPTKATEPAKQTAAVAPPATSESSSAKAPPPADTFIQEKSAQLGALELRMAQELETRLQAASNEKDFGKKLDILDDVEKNGTAIRTSVTAIQSEFVRKKKDGEQKQRAAQLAGAASGHVEKAAAHRNEIKQSDGYKQWALQNDPAFSGAQVQFANGVVTVPNCSMDQCRAIAVMVQAMEIVFGRPPKLIQIRSTGYDARKYSAELAITARGAQLRPLAITQTLDSPTQITLKFAVTPEAEQALVGESPEGRLDALRSKFPVALKKTAQVGEEEKYVWFSGPPVAALRPEFSAVMTAIQDVYGRKPVAAILKTGVDESGGDAQKLNEAVGASGIPSTMLHDGRGSGPTDVLLFFDHNEMLRYFQQHAEARSATPRPAPSSPMGDGIGRRKATEPVALEKPVVESPQVDARAAAAAERQRQEATAKEAAAAKAVTAFSGHTRAFLQQLDEAQYDSARNLKDAVKEILPALALLRAKVQGEVTEMQNVASTYPKLQQDADNAAHKLSAVMAQIDLALIENEVPVLRLAIDAAVRKTDSRSLDEVEATLNRLATSLGELAKTSESGGIQFQRQEMGLTRDKLLKARADVATNLKTYESPEGRKQSMKGRLKYLGDSLQVEAAGKYFWLTAASPDHVEAEGVTLLKAASDVFHKPIQSVLLRVPQPDLNKTEMRVMKVLGAMVQVQIVRDPRVTGNPSVYFFFNEADMSARDADLSQQVAEEIRNRRAIHEAEEQQRAAPRNKLNALAQKWGGRAVEEVVEIGDKKGKKKEAGKSVYIARVQVQDASEARQFIEDVAIDIRRATMDQFLIFAHPEIAKGLVGGPNAISLRPARLGGIMEGSRVFELNPAKPGEVYVVTSSGHDPISQMGHQFNEKFGSLIPLLQKLGANNRAKWAPAKDTSAEQAAQARNAEIAARAATAERGIMATRQQPPPELPKAHTPTAVPTPATPTPTAAPAPIPAPAPSSAPAAEPAFVVGQPVRLPNVFGLQQVQSKDFKKLYGYKRGAIEVYSGLLGKKDVAGNNLEFRLRAVFSNGLEKGARSVYVIYRGQTDAGDKNQAQFTEVARKVSNDVGLPVTVKYRLYPSDSQKHDDEIHIILKMSPDVTESKIYEQYLKYLKDTWGT